MPRAPTGSSTSSQSRTGTRCGCARSPATRHTRSWPRRSTVSGNSVIVVTDGYIGDAPPYQGHVVTLDRATGRIQHVWNALCSDRRYLQVPHTCPASDGAIWGRAGAVLEPGSGNVLVTTGNAPFNGRTNWGDSVLELSPDASRLLQNFTPTDQAKLNGNDADLGSTSPALLPNPGGPPLAVQGGKDGKLKLLDLRHLNGVGGAGARLGGRLQAIAEPGGGQMFTAPAVWVSGGRTYMFVADDQGTTAYVLRAGSSPRLEVLWRRGSAGTSPVLAGGSAVRLRRDDRPPERARSTHRPRLCIAAMCKRALAESDRRGRPGDLRHRQRERPQDERRARDLPPG